MSDSEDPREFEIVQWVEAPVAEVFSYFTDSEKMALWHGVEVRLSSVGERTKIELSYQGFAPGDPVEAGWRHFLPGLTRVV